MKKEDVDRTSKKNLDEKRQIQMENSLSHFKIHG